MRVHCQFQRLLTSSQKDFYLLSVLLLFAISFSCCLLTPGIFFLCGTTTYLCLPTNWTGTCTLVYLAPDISIAPNNRTLPIPLTHNQPGWAIQFIPLLISLGIAGGIGTRMAGLTTSLNYYQSLSKDLTESLGEIATSLIIIQNQLDSMVAIVLQNRRGLDLLTAEKGGLCLFLDEEMATHYNTLAWKIPWMEEPGGLRSMESQRVGHD